MSDHEVNNATIQIRLPKSLLDRLDIYRSNLTIRPSRSQVIRFLLEHALAIVEAKRNES